MNEEEFLKKMILEQNESYSAIGKILGISGNAVKKRAKQLGIKLPQRRKINEIENFSHKKTETFSFVNAPSDEEFIDIIKSSKTWVEIGKKLGYKCKCLASNTKKTITERCSKLGMELQLTVNDDVHSKTKGELFNNRKNWQSARSAIQKDARKVFFENTENPSCHICGYKNHVEVAHIKAVSDFDDCTPVSVINSISNLIGLCPNHHWEYDNGVLIL